MHLIYPDSTQQQLSLGQLGSSVVGCICFKNIYSSGGHPGKMCLPGFEWVGYWSGILIRRAGLNSCVTLKMWGPLNFLCDVIITLSMSILVRPESYSHILIWLIVNRFSAAETAQWNAEEDYTRSHHQGCSIDSRNWFGDKYEFSLVSLIKGCLM